MHGQEKGGGTATGCSALRCEVPGTMALMLLPLLAGSALAAEGPPFKSFNCTTLPKAAFEPVTLKNSVRALSLSDLGLCLVCCHPPRSAVTRLTSALAFRCAEGNGGHVHPVRRDLHAPRCPRQEG